MKNRKGFTLIELLAVIVILGLLMAIAIPSVTKYITESRKKTLTTTVNNYIGALVNEVNDLEYTFTGNNTIYAVPIECISLERGGTNPFGEWMQANDSYWAYVLIQYDDQNSKYVYGFTFKDSAGYGLYPTIQSNIKEKGSQIKTGYDLNRPVSGDITSLTTLAKWQQSGFEVDSTTNFQVLEATSEGETGDGETTCTLCQKGNNYAQVEEEKANRPQLLTKLIKEHNTLITATPTLTTSSNNTSDASGLYSSTETNSSNPTYYFRGNVTNNYVSFAGLTWKIIRINEDGTVRLILNSRVNASTYKFNSTSNDYLNMYYSNSDTAKPIVDNWYQKNIVDKGYDFFVVTGSFCEQSKVKYSLPHSTGNAKVAVYTSYSPDFKCITDGNGYGVISSKVGLITYDEVVFAGGYYGKNNNKYYLFVSGGKDYWTMSPNGVYMSNYVNMWCVCFADYLYSYSVNNDKSLRPVINLNANVIATGTGTSTDPYVVITE